MHHLIVALVLISAPAFLAAATSTPTSQVDSWAFDISGNVFEAGPIDLRDMNEKTAGQHGFVRVSEDGNDFVRGDGVPIRFWGAAANVNAKVSDDELVTHARFLARMGVNMVRVGGATAGLMPQQEGAAITDVNAGFLTDVWRTVAIMKREGIYTRVSPLWDHGAVKYINPDWGIEGYASGDAINGLLCFEPTLQKGYKEWMRILLTTTNSYTGMPLKDDPACAILQIVSEDSILFWFFDRIKDGPRRLLEARFHTFVTNKYGTVAKALKEWSGAELEGDSPTDGRLALYPMYDMTQPPNAKTPLRLRDQVEFLARLEHDFYADMRAYLRNELGAKQIIGASNFGPASKEYLNDLQRWTWTACDVIELNSFFSTDIKGPQSFWRIQPGHTFDLRSATKYPALPAARKQVAGMPYILSSTTWTPPNVYAIEGPVIQSVYAAMNGIDGLMWFACSAPAYDPQPYFTFVTVAGSHPMKRWTISYPGFLSQFPAAALIYRRGLVERAGVVVHEERTLERLFAREPALIGEEVASDPNGDLYYRGRVELVPDGNPDASDILELTDLSDESGAVVSTHGQLTLDRTRGLLLIDAPGAQGAVGFLADAGGHFETADVVLDTGNAFGAIVAVTMDGKPLASSGKVLVQVGTVCLPTGWKTKPVEGDQGEPGRDARVEIVSTGTLPWRMEHVHATLSLANTNVVKATLLDEMGMPAENVPVQPGAKGISLTLPENTLYLLLEGADVSATRAPPTDVAGLSEAGR